MIDYKKYLVANKSMCCGCESCVQVCPTNAIRMVPMELGSLYPVIDSKKCVQCGACERVCIYTREIDKNTTPQVYAAAGKDKQLMRKSASGGVFAALAHRVLNADGMVFGCSMELVDGILTPMHIGIQNHEDVVKLQGSKYVQSTLDGVFPEIKRLLRQGKIILFSGTPCQVAALKRFLKGESTDRLYTIDLICHGVPSRELFQGYIQSLEQKHGSKLTAFFFRDKTKGWGLDALYHYCDKSGFIKNRRLPSNISSYYSLFLQSETYRESCYDCCYANAYRVGDITIGDFWGIEQEYPDFLEENGGCFSTADGISTILVNNLQGKDLLAQYGEDLELRESTLACVTKWNRQLSTSSKHSVVRTQLIEAYQAKGYIGVEKVFRKQLGARYYVRAFRQWYSSRFGV